MTMGTRDWLRIDYGGGITEEVFSTYVNNTSDSAYLLGILKQQYITKTRYGTIHTQMTICFNIHQWLAP